MNRCDYESVLAKAKKRLNVSWVLFGLLAAVFVAGFALGVIFATYEKRALFMGIFSPILGVLSIVLVGLLVFGILENRKIEKQIVSILGGYLTVVEGTVESVGNPITSLNGRKGIELLVEEKKGYPPIAVYFDPTFGEVPFKEKERVQLKVSESFIVQYEVHHE